jgi:hypothetical protein
VESFKPGRRESTEQTEIFLSAIFLSAIFPREFWDQRTFNWRLFDSGLSVYSRIVAGKLS